MISKKHVFDLATLAAEVGLAYCIETTTIKAIDTLVPDDELSTGEFISKLLASTTISLFTGVTVSCFMVGAITAIFER